jgi:hypothetical protein
MSSIWKKIRRFFVRNMVAIFITTLIILLLAGTAFNMYYYMKHFK